MNVINNNNKACSCKIKNKSFIITILNNDDKVRYKKCIFLYTTYLQHLVTIALMNEINNNNILVSNNMKKESYKK